ncbi:MAG: prepilin-type N-terminal cleavage/methylation domain-containing protein [Candidatus Paceibacterota bacterium]
MYEYTNKTTRFLKRNILSYFRKLFVFRRQNGSTLIELLLALGIFSIFISVITGGFIQMLSNQRLLLKLMASTDNVSLSLEQIARELRTGGQFQTSPGGGDLIQFFNADKKFVKYYLNINSSRGQLVRSESLAVDDPSPVIRPITADNVDVSQFNVEVMDINPSGPPRVVINVGVRVSERKIKEVNTFIQTTVSPRNIE